MNTRSTTRLNQHVCRAALAVTGILLAAQTQAAVNFQLQVVTRTEPMQSGKAAPPDTHFAHDVTVADKFIAVKSERHITVYDFSVRKRTVADLKTQTRIEYSLYDTVGFRISELRNRQRLKQVLAAAKVDVDLMGQLDNEHTLSVQETPFSPLQTALQGESEVFSSGAKALLRRSLKGTPVSAKDAYRFAQYVRYTFGGHPQILRALADGNAIPSKLQMSTYDAMRATHDMEFASVQPVVDKAPDLSAFALRAYEHVSDPVDKQLDRAVNAADTDKVKKQATVQDEVASLFGEGRALDALLATIEWSLMTGGQLPAMAPEQREKLQSDKSVPLLMGALNPARTKEGLAQAIKVLTELRSAAPAKQHVLRIFEANHRAALGERGAARDLFVDALTVNPFIAGAYKDLGDIAYTEFDTARAWRSWDQGRRLAPGFPIFGVINQLEASLLKSQPDYF